MQVINGIQLVKETEALGIYPNSRILFIPDHEVDGSVVGLIYAIGSTTEEEELTKVQNQISKRGINAYQLYDSEYTEMINSSVYRFEDW